jgi:hypothetical protein
MLNGIKKIVSKVKNFVLRVPNEKKLCGCFKDEFPNTPNPVTKSKMKSHEEVFGLSAAELDQLIIEQQKLAAETPKVIVALKETLGTYEGRPQNQERPKFKCKVSADEAEQEYAQKQEHVKGQEFRKQVMDRVRETDKLIGATDEPYDDDAGTDDRVFAEEIHAQDTKPRPVNQERPKFKVACENPPIEMGNNTASYVTDTLSKEEIEAIRAPVRAVQSVRPVNQERPIFKRDK